MGYGRYKNLWPMRQPGFLNREREIFKCTECGAETHPSEGHNGEPDAHRCRPDCRCRSKLTIVHTADFGSQLAQVRMGTLAADVPMKKDRSPQAEANERYTTHYEETFKDGFVPRWMRDEDVPAAEGARSP